MAEATSPDSPGAPKKKRVITLRIERGRAVIVTRCPECNRPQKIEQTLDDVGEATFEIVCDACLRIEQHNPPPADKQADDDEEGEEWKRGGRRD